LRLRDGVVAVGRGDVQIHVHLTSLSGTSSVERRFRMNWPVGVRDTAQCEQHEQQALRETRRIVSAHERLLPRCQCVSDIVSRVSSTGQ
jgi:hypothetical protein